MKRYPYERFLRFLVSRKLDANRTLDRLGLPRAGDLWIVECRRNLRQTAPAALRQFLEAPESSELTFRDGVLEWAETEGIRVLWEMQPEFGAKQSSDFDAVWSLFSHPTSRAIVGMLFLSRASGKEILDIIGANLGAHLTDAQLELYRRLFWDVTQIERAAWGPFTTILKTQEEANYISFGVNAPSADEVRDLLNLDVSGVDHRSIINNIISKSYHQYKRAMESANPEANNAFTWAELTLKAINTAKAAGGFGPAADAETLGTPERFRKLFSVEPGRMKIPSLADMIGDVGRPEDKESRAKAKADK